MRPGRIALATGVATLVTAAPAAAAFGPPLRSVPGQLRTLPIVQVHSSGQRAPSSCSVHGRRLRGSIGRVERKLAPVACEQPPRSNVLDTAIAIFIAP